MKKISITLMLLLCIGLSAQAQSYFKNGNKNGEGLFCRGLVSDEVYYGAYTNYNGHLFYKGLPGIPGGHGEDEDQPAPLGSGALMLLGFGAAYALVKKRKDQ